MHGIQTGSWNGGFVVEREQPVLLLVTEVVGGVPECSGRRCVHPGGFRSVHVPVVVAFETVIGMAAHLFDGCCGPRIVAVAIDLTVAPATVTAQDGYEPKDSKSDAAQIDTGERIKGILGLGERQDIEAGTDRPLQFDRGVLTAAVRKLLIRVFSRWRLAWTVR